MSTPRNPRAFPTQNGSSGMSLRDYFAAQVAGGDAAADGWATSAAQHAIDDRARLYYRIADAMLVARAEKPEEE